VLHRAEGALCELLSRLSVGTGKKPVGPVKGHSRCTPVYKVAGKKPVVLLRRTQPVHPCALNRRENDDWSFSGWTIGGPNLLPGVQAPAYGKLETPSGEVDSIMNTTLGERIGEVQGSALSTRAGTPLIRCQ